MHEHARMQLVAPPAHIDLGEPLAAQSNETAVPLLRFGLQMLGHGRLAKELVREWSVRLWRNACGFNPSRTSREPSGSFMMARGVAIDISRLEHSAGQAAATLDMKPRNPTMSPPSSSNTLPCAAELPVGGASRGTRPRARRRPDLAGQVSTARSPDAPRCSSS